MSWIFLSFSATANEWVVGNVAIVEDYRAYDTVSGILITLTNASYFTIGSAQALCPNRFRVVVGQEGITDDVQKNIFALAMAARLSGDKVRLFVNPNNNLGKGYCAVQIGSLGDV